MSLAMLAEAWRAMGANRLRSFLTMLGMMIGVAAVILMLAVGQGAQYMVEQSIAAMGSNLFIVLSGSTTSGGLRMGTGTEQRLTTADAEAIGELPSGEARHVDALLRWDQPGRGLLRPAEFLVDDDGALLVRTAGGTLVRVEAGDVTLRA